MPSITAIPNSAMKPIAAETLNAVPEISRPRTPPNMAMGMTLMASRVSRIEPKLNQSRTPISASEIGTTIDQLEVICKQRGITPVSRYCEVPLALDVKVISSFGRLYLDLLMLFDQAMVILQSLMLYGILDEQDCHDQKGVFKALVREIARDARRARVALLVDGSLADGTAHSASTPEHDEGAATPGEPGTAGGAETPPADARSVA